MGKVARFGICAVLSFFLVFSSTYVFAEPANVNIAQREMKGNPGESRLRTRVHEMIHANETKDERVRIAIILSGDENIVVEDRVKNEVYHQLRQKFPRESFAVMKGTDVGTYLLQNAEDSYYNQRQTVVMHHDPGDPHHTDDEYIENRPSKEDVDGVPVRMQPRGLADVRRDDLVKAGRAYNYDYVFMLSLSNGLGTKYKHLFSTSVNKNVWIRIRFVDTKSGNYVYRNDIVAAGKTHNGNINGRVMERSVQKAMREAMNDIEVSYPQNEQ